MLERPHSGLAGFARRAGRRAFDFILTTFGLIVLAPVLISVALAIWASDGRPVLFTQQRAGLGGRPFLFYKFRTMTNDRDPDGSLLPDDERITRVGAFLRSTTLDELPSLFNVLKGDMSIVGPRPLYHDYVALYTKEQGRRLETKPGLTGWAVVKGRNALSWEERFRLDVWYVDHRNLWLDIKIILLTVFKIVRREDVCNESHATMPRFEGTRPEGGD